MRPSGGPEARSGSIDREASRSMVPTITRLRGAVRGPPPLGFGTPTFWPTFLLYESKRGGMEKLRVWRLVGGEAEMRQLTTIPSSAARCRILQQHSGPA